MSGGRWLALPVVAILFLQWPLRDAVRCCSREANDLGQWLFAMFIAIAITAATRAGTHVAMDSWAKSRSAQFRRGVAIAGALFVLVPWSVAIVAMIRPTAIASVLMLERFPDTANPGYFLIKVAALILAGLVFLQALVDALSPRDRA